MQPNLVIWGASGHAKVVADIIHLTKNYRIVGFLDSLSPQRQGEFFCQASILGGQEQLESLKSAGTQHIILGFGKGQARLDLTELVLEHGFSLATAIHPAAVIAPDVTIAPGTVVAAAAVINPAVQIGSNVIVNTSASVDHDCVIEDGSHICPGVHLAGNVTIGRATWVGIGATVIGGIRVGAGTVIGAGAVVIDDIPDGVVAYGVPAKVVKRVSRD
jgi:UDP-N-acetylbacillosamine N-acetyltransferase